MTDTFIWRVHSTASGGGRFAVNKTQFGDGFSQVVPQGLNPHTQQWSITVSAYTADIKTIRDFLVDHIGESFFWKPPLGVTGYYRCDEGYDPVDQGGGYFTLNAKFYEAPPP